MSTIVGISTALGVSAINIVRISGDDAFIIANKIFKGKDLTKVESHTVNYGFIVDNEEKIDEVLISVMKAPKTYTRENIVEINCHGGIATTNKILELLLLNGCVLAEPGEFTKRAFLNGRIDLLEAEGVMDLLKSKTEHSMKLALNQVDGKVSLLIKELRQKILEILANIEVNIDYPEYEDILDLTIEHLKPSLILFKDRLNHILNESENGKLIKEGIKTVIIGRPNVGKSSLLNRLINEEKAIVTDIAGTTRDIVEGNLNIDGILLNIIDTAGIRNTTDLVESIGVKKSFDLIEEADLILMVISNTEKLVKEEYELLENLKNKNHIIIINKCDLESKTDYLNKENTVRISAIEDINIDELKAKVKEMFNISKFKESDLTYLSSARSIALLKSAIIEIESVEKGIEINMPVDMLEIDIKKIWSILGEIIGETYQEELIDQLFSQFCLGK